MVLKHVPIKIIHREFSSNMKIPFGSEVVQMKSLTKNRTCWF